MIYAGGGRDFEFITEVNGTPRNEGADKLGGIPADSPLDYYVRIISDGENLTAAYSYNGNTFTPVGRPVSLATFADAEDRPGCAVRRGCDRAGRALRLDPLRPGRLGGGGSEGIVDNFDGTELGAAWSRVRPTQAAVVGSGTLQIPARPGDIYQTRNDAQDLIVRDAPDGAWQAITKINFEGTAQYQQAGIMVYGNDDNFTKFGRIAHSAAGDEKFEFINEVNAVARNEAADSTANIPAAFPDDFWLRLTSDGTNVVGHYSTDGTTWTPVGRPAALPADAKIGLFAFSNEGTGNPVAAFDSFTLTGDAVGGGGGGGGTPSGPSYDDQFDGATLDKTRWNAIVRDTPAQYALAGGELKLHAQPGRHLHGRHRPAAEQLHPPGRVARRRGLGDRDQDQQLHARRWLRPGRPDGLQGRRQLHQVRRHHRRRTTRGEPDRAPLGDRRRHPGAAVQRDRHRRSGGRPVLAAADQDGQHLQGRVLVRRHRVDGDPEQPGDEPDGRAGLRLFGFSPQAIGVGDTVSFDYFTLNGPDPSTCEQCDGPGDTFAGDKLDATRWNAIAQDDPAKYSVADGALKVTTTLGEIYQAGTGGGPLLLQAADHAGADWVLETKLTNTLNGGYSQGGILAYGDDNNYVKINAISDEGNARVNRLELRSEVGGTVSAIPTDPQVTAAQAAGPIWLKLSKAGNTYTGQYKFTETGQWQNFSGTVTNAMAAPKFGLYTQGVLQAGDTVTFEYFSVDGDSRAARRRTRTSRRPSSPRPRRRRPASPR